MIDDELIAAIDVAEQALLAKANWIRAKKPNLIGNYLWSEDGHRLMAQIGAATIVRLCQMFDPPSDELTSLIQAEAALLLAHGWEKVKEHPVAFGMAEWKTPLTEPIPQMAAVDQIRTVLWDAKWDKAMEHLEEQRAQGKEVIVSFTELLP